MAIGRLVIMSLLVIVTEIIGFKIWGPFFEKYWQEHGDPGTPMPSIVYAGTFVWFNFVFLMGVVNAILKKGVHPGWW